MSPYGKRPLKTTRSSPETEAEVTSEIEPRPIGIYDLSDDERAAVRQGIDAARRGDFAPQDEMEEFYRLHRGV
jgi:hypothetical protein